MPGTRSPLKPMVSSFLTTIHDSVNKGIHDIESRTKEFARERMIEVKYVDVKIQFIGASGLPKMDLVGSADPYFVAKIDNQVSYVSSVQQNTLTPAWNEHWFVNNVPERATLRVEVWDKDEGSPTDDFIGCFETTVTPGTKEVEVVSTLLKIVKGSFWLKIDVSPTKDPTLPQYIFDGPIRWSSHRSPTVGQLTRLNDERLYCTWKMYLRGVRLFLGSSEQHWNRSYKAAQTIFQGPTSLAVRSSIQAAHRMLYARTTRDKGGFITSPKDVYALLRGGPGAAAHRVKPAVYTYIIAVQDDSFRFSETGAAFFVDFASKHALHSNCAESVRYSGELHPRPAGGWENFNDEIPDEQVAWELVIDNNSGTYSPDPALLPQVKALFEYNFPGFNVYALDYKDPELAKSREACRAYALEHRGVKQQELQPHAAEGEETLLHHVQAHPFEDHIEEQPPADLERLVR